MPSWRSRRESWLGGSVRVRASWSIWPVGVALVGSRPSRRGQSMDCVTCGSSAVAERPERTARGYRRFRCRECGKQYNERSGSLLNDTQHPSDVIALVVLWRLRYRLTLRDLAKMFLVRGIIFSHEAVREWEAKLAPVLADELRQRRHGKRGTRGRPISESPWPVGVPVSRHRPRRQSRGHDAERAPRHGGGSGFLPLGQGCYRRDARPGHHGRARFLPAGDPLDARPAGRSSEQRIQE